MMRMDAVVVGAGTAGSAAAYHLARKGLRVLLLDRRGADEAGASWVNGVPPGMFEEADIPLPEEPERCGHAGAFHVLSPTGDARVTVPESPVWQVDMRLLVRRLQRMARSAGAEVRFGMRPVRLEGDARRGRTLVCQAGDGSQKTRLLRIEAPLFVDAGGLAGALGRLRPGRPTALPREDLCAAAQEVRVIRDRAGAEAFLEAMRARPGDALAWTGFEGGYSTLAVTVTPDFEEVHLLTGAAALPGLRSGKRILDDFAAERDWVGETIFGGAGVIPICRSADRFVEPGIASIGDSALHVFPAHGSGIGNGLVAARLLAEAVGEALNPGSPEVLWGYQCAWQRGRGAVAAAYDEFRRFSQSVAPGDLAALMASGLLQAELVAAGLAQEMPRITPALIARMAPAARRRPDLAGRLLPVVARMRAVHALYRRFPRRDGWRYAAWREAVTRLRTQGAPGKDPLPEIDVEAA